jgi:hypothetical protein
MKKLLIFISVILVLVVAGCNNSSATEKSTETNDEKTEEKQQEKESKEDFFEIGENGVIENEYGKFEYTLNDVELLPNINGETPTNEVFLKATFSFKNLNDETIENADDINYFSLSDNQGRFAENTIGFDEMKNIQGEWKPNEVIVGEVIFDTYNSPSYRLLHVNKFEWRFSNPE